MKKAQLKAYREIKRERDDIKRRREELEDTMYGPRSQNLNGMPRGCSGENYLREEQIDRKDELLAMYKAKEAELDAALLAIEQAIEKLTPTQRLLVRLHYFDGLTWEQVAVEIDYSWSQTHRIHSAALKRLKEEEDAKE